MRLPLARFTVRRMMVMVALAALVLAGDQWRRRYHACERSAAQWAVAEQSHLRMADGHEKVAALYRKLAARRRGSLRYNVEQARFFAGFAGAEHLEARRAAERGAAYRRAGLFPWLPIPTGEPEAAELFSRKQAD